MRIDYIFLIRSYLLKTWIAGGRLSCLDEAVPKGVLIHLNNVFILFPWFYRRVVYKLLTWKKLFLSPQCCDLDCQKSYHLCVVCSSQKCRGFDFQYTILCHQLVNKEKTIHVGITCVRSHKCCSINYVKSNQTSTHNLRL